MIVRLEKVTKNYQIENIPMPALREIDLVIKEQDFLVISGTSGSGKTTLLNLIGCLDYPDSGDIFIMHQKVSAFSPNEMADFRRKHLSYIFKSFNLLPHMNLFHNIAFPLVIQSDRSQRQQKALIELAISDVGLADSIQLYPHELTGGQLQRAALARALVKKPKLLLADEPTANLDSKTREQFLELMKNLNEKYQTTFIFSTSESVVMDYADRLISLNDGEIVSDEQRKRP